MWDEVRFSQPTVAKLLNSLENLKRGSLINQFKTLPDHEHEYEHEHQHTKVFVQENPVGASLLPTKEFLRTVKNCLKSLLPVLRHFEKICKIWKGSRQFELSLNRLKGFQTVWKVSEQSGKFPKSLKCFKIVWNHKKIDIWRPFITALSNQQS